MGYAVNASAAEMYSRDIEHFKAFVRETFLGGTFQGLSFPAYRTPQCPSHDNSQAFPDLPLQQTASQQPHPASLTTNSLKRKCRYGVDGAGPPTREWTPPDSDLEAMCIQDPLEDAQGTGMMGMDTQDCHGGTEMQSRFRQQQERSGEIVAGGSGGGEGGGTVGGPREWEELASRKRPCLTPVPMNERQSFRGAGREGAGCHAQVMGTVAAAHPGLAQQHPHPFSLRRDEGGQLGLAHPPQAQVIFPGHAAACMPYSSPLPPPHQQQHSSPLLNMPAARHGAI